MTKDLKTIDLNLLPIETLKEMANESGEQVENSARLTVQKAADCGRYLTAIKEQLEHGEWSAWLAANWDYSQKKACQYMLIAANFTLGLNLKEAASVYGALQMIADSKPEKTAPRSSRKPADVKVSIPADHIADDSKKVDTGTDNKMWLVTNAELQALDDDPAPDPPTQRKTAKGSEKVPEADKPRTQQVPVEIVEDEPEADPWEYMTFEEILSVAVSKLADDQKKKAAKELRKVADKLDPPDETKAAKIPTVSELKTLIDKTELSDQMLAAVTDWVQYKQKHPDKKYRYQSGESFTRDQKRMTKVYMQTGEPFVLEAIDTAIAKGWRGWEQDSTSNGKANSNGHTTAHRGATKRRPTVEEVFG